MICSFCVFIYNVCCTCSCDILFLMKERMYDNFIIWSNLVEIRILLAMPVSSGTHWPTGPWWEFTVCWLTQTWIKTLMWTCKSYIHIGSNHWSTGFSPNVQFQTANKVQKGLQKKAFTVAPDLLLLENLPSTLFGFLAGTRLGLAWTRMEIVLTCILLYYL